MSRSCSGPLVGGWARACERASERTFVRACVRVSVRVDASTRGCAGSSRIGDPSLGVDWSREIGLTERVGGSGDDGCAAPDVRGYGAPRDQTA